MLHLRLYPIRDRADHTELILCSVGCCSNEYMLFLFLGFYVFFVDYFFIYFIKTDDPNVIIFLCLDLSVSVTLLFV
jgi:hypothetical protein